MNRATAEGFLGGEVSKSTSAIKKWQDEGVCEFRRPNSEAMLRIEVRVMQSPKTEFAGYLAKCPADAKPLKAIGNEAVWCQSDDERRVIARVRDQAFIVTISHAGNEDSARKAAEIVSGNLF